MSYGRHADRSYTYTMVNDGQSAGGRSLSVHVNFGTCHVRYMIDEIRYMSISVHSATMTDIPSCCVLDSRHSQADLLLLKAYVEEIS